jgi:hypothetical protein
MSDDLKETAILIQKDFDIAEQALAASYEDLERLLHVRIVELLNRDFEKLLQICYRIDLGEQKLKQILYQSEAEFMSIELTRALIKRQMLKVELRRKYAQE